MAGLSCELELTYWRATAFGLGLLLVLRVGFLLVSPLNLYADEAQYWRWGETLAWGYYSKPPMIAWVIHGVTTLLGNAEWAVRLAAPFLHTAGAVILFFLGRAIYDARTGMYAAFLYALMPAVILSSAVISTDGVLMPFWCGALYALWRLRSGEGRWASAVGLGAAVGAGFLAKYAMLYFLIGIGLTLAFDRDTRRALLSWRGLVALIVACTIFAPHLAWNAANDFKTVSHTVDNANLGGDLFHPDHALTFLADQMGVFGPISLIAFVFGLFAMRKAGDALKARDRWLLCFVIPVLVIILVQAVLSRANANWAATAWPAASVLVAAWLIRMAPAGVRWLWASLALHVALGVLFVTVPLVPAAAASQAGFDNELKRTRGWDTAANAVFAKAAEIGATSVLVDEREVWHGLDYYARDRKLPLISWRRYGVPKSFSEAVPMAPPIDEKVLVVSLHAEMRPMMRSDFKTFEDIGEITIPLGERRNGCPLARRFHVYIGSGFAPELHDDAWEARHDGLAEFKAPPCPAPKAQ